MTGYGVEYLNELSPADHKVISELTQLFKDERNRIIDAHKDLLQLTVNFGEQLKEKDAEIERLKGEIEYYIADADLIAKELIDAEDHIKELKRDRKADFE